MQHRQEVIDRLQILRSESGQSDREFKRTLAKITGKTPRTIRRWFARETTIQEEDLKTIAEHFGQHMHWLKYGDVHERRNMVDQIMASNHYGVVIMKGGKAEEINYKFMEMMNLSPTELNGVDICDYVLSKQSNETVNLCNISGEHALSHGTYHHHMIMRLGDDKPHNIEVTSLCINNGRVLRILVDKGIVGRT